MTALSLSDYFANSSFAQQDVDFSLADLAKAFEDSRFRNALSIVTINNNQRRSISLEGRPAESFTLGISDKKLLLNITDDDVNLWDKDYEIASLSFKFGIHLVLVNGTIQAYVPAGVEKIQKSEYKVLGKPKKSLFGTEDIALLEAVMVGDVDALGKYFYRLNNRLAGHARMAGLDDANSEDAVQEAFIVIFNKMQEPEWKDRNFATPFQFAKFIGTTVYNRAMNIKKLSFNRRHVSIDDGLAGIDPDKQEHHIPVSDLAPELDEGFFLDDDPMTKMEKFDVLAYINELENYAGSAGSQSLDYLLEYAEASLKADELIPRHQFVNGLGVSSVDMGKHFVLARADLEKVGLGRRSILDGCFSSVIPTSRIYAQHAII